MVQLLDDEHLERLQCSKCHKYLSVFPVKNHATRDVTCGRCSTDDDDGVRSTLYELVAERYLFKCVNRYEGCRELLRAHETRDHERTCVGNVFACPKCRDGVEWSILALVWHYKVRHPASYLRSNRLEVRSAPIDDAMLYVGDEVVFVVTIRRGSRVVRMSVATLTEGVVATQTFSTIVNSVVARTETRRCVRHGLDDEPFVVDVDPDASVEVVFDVEVTDGGTPRLAPSEEPSPIELSPEEPSPVEPSPVEPPSVEFVPGEGAGYKLIDGGSSVVDGAGRRIDLLCSNCKRYVGLPVFRCKKSRHQICYDCRTWCGICGSSVREFISNDELIEVGRVLRFACRWKCGEYFTSDLRGHERECELRSKRCCVCQEEVRLKLMNKHLHYKHSIYAFQEIYELNYCDENEQFYFLLNNRWCSLECRVVSQYDEVKVKLDFTLLDWEPGTELYIIYRNSMLPSSDIHYTSNDGVSLYTPYLKFNRK